jgi:multidrug resistance efflux pump
VTNDGPRPPTFGFPRPETTPGAEPIARPTPLPKRPKGRWFIGMLLLAACGYGVYQVWDTFFRYRAYGTITGRSIQLSPPWDGLVRSIHVREGDEIRQGQLLITLDNSELRQRQAQIADESRVALASLRAEIARLKWQTAFHLDQSQDAVALYYESWGQLLQQEARLEKLRSDNQRNDYLKHGKAVTAQELDQLQFDIGGQQKSLEKLRLGLEERRKRAELSAELLAHSGELSDGLSADGRDQLAPFEAKIAALEAESTRIGERLAEGQIRAPCNSRVLKIARFTGEHCRIGDAILTLLEEGSMRIVVYMPQHASRSLEVDDQVRVVVDPYQDRLACTVIKVGDQYEAAPEQIKRHYVAGQNQLPVILQPGPESAHWMALRLGGVVKLP